MALINGYKWPTRNLYCNGYNFQDFETQSIPMVYVPFQDKKWINGSV